MVVLDVNDLQSPGIAMLLADRVVNQETPYVESVRRSCSRPANSKSLTEKVKKSAKMAGFSRLLSPMSSMCFQCYSERYIDVTCRHHKIR
jgi:hypothetical protein